MPVNTIELIELVKSVAVKSAAIVPKGIIDRLSILWACAPMIAAGLAVTLVLASVVLVLIGPRYTGRAMIQFNFVREETTKDMKISPTASVDAIAVLNNAAPIIRSPATAGAVVTRLGLDDDPAFAHGSLAWRVFSSMRSLLGLEAKVPSKQDLAAEQLARRITVTSDPRSYLISISVTASDPDRAARLANAVALEYLRGQLVQQVTDAYGAAEREMSEMSSIYGARHPAYQSQQAKVESLRLRLRALREEPFDEAAAGRVTGQSFVAAQKVMIPSGPNVLLVLGLAALLELAVGTWLALQPWAHRQTAA
jgi:uncharacterized protein involved in exopolysaccharide biosynthesis